MKISLPFVLGAGLIDSLNPCAIAILLLFIALMFTLKKSRQTVLLLGGFYIIAVFFTYLLIGLGLLRAIHLFGIPHFIAKLGAWAVILVGIINLKDVFFPKLPFSLRISVSSRQKIADWAHKSTIPAALGTGFLVGICEFPCSGAIYLSILGLLALKSSFLKGLGYLVLYNLIFILPLVIIYLVTTNRMVTEKLIFWQETYSQRMRFAGGILMIFLGIAILIWFV